MATLFWTTNLYEPICELLKEILVNFYLFVIVVVCAKDVSVEGNCSHDMSLHDQGQSLLQDVPNNASPLIHRTGSSLHEHPVLF